MSTMRDLDFDKIFLITCIALGIIVPVITVYVIEQRTQSEVCKDGR